MRPNMNHPTDVDSFSIETSKDSSAINLFSLWFGLLVFFFSPEIVHAGFLDHPESLTTPDRKKTTLFIPSYSDH